jgi:hypothetical protein
MVGVFMAAALLVEVVSVYMCPCPEFSVCHGRSQYVSVM